MNPTTAIRANAAIQQAQFVMYNANVVQDLVSVITLLQQENYDLINQLAKFQVPPGTVREAIPEETPPTTS